MTEDVLVRQDGDEDRDVEEPPEDAGVDDDEGEDAVVQMSPHTP